MSDWIAEVKRVIDENERNDPDFYASPRLPGVPFYPYTPMGTAVPTTQTTGVVVRDIEDEYNVHTVADAQSLYASGIVTLDEFRHFVDEAKK